MRRRRFFVVVLAVFFLLYFYLGWSLFLTFDLDGRLLGYGALALGYAAILWMPFVLWNRDSDETAPWEKVAQWVAFCSMGYLSFVLALSAGKDLLGLAFLAPRLETFRFALRSPVATRDVLVLAGLLFVLGAINARHRVSVRKTEITLPGLPEGLRGLRIVQISDLHVGPTIRKPYVEKVVALARSCDPDLIVLTGDMIDGTVRELAPELAPLSALSAPLGRFYVPGNHEYYWDAEPWIAHFRGMGFTPLLNENRVLQKGASRMVLAGVPDFTAATMGAEGPDFARALQGAPTEARPRVLLCHQPKSAREAAAAGYDLQLSGHTHGGQFFPWTFVARWIHPFLRGLSVADGMQIYVSSGTGYWGPPVRLGTSAEVSLLILA